MADEIYGDKNKDIVWILEYALEICSILADLKKEWEAESLLFKIPQEEEFTQLDEHFADKLFEDIYFSISGEKGDGAQKRSTEGSGIVFDITNEERDRNTQVIVENTFSDIRYTPLNRQNDESLTELLTILDNSFLPEDKLAGLSKRMDAFLKTRRELAESKSPFPRYSLIETYLENYYQLLVYFMSNEQTLGEMGNDIPDLLLRFDNDENSVSILAPLALNNLRRMYFGTEQYYRKLIGAGRNDDVLRLFYKNVICKKVQHSFRWFVHGEGGQRKHVAVAPKAEKNKELNLMVACREIIQYNSYEGIGELRTAEKILYEMGKWDQLGSENISEFRIAILGDISREPMHELVEYLEGVMESERRPTKRKLRFSVYSKNFEKEETQEEVGSAILNYYNCLDEVFSNRNLMRNLLCEHEVIFMMDCIKLYCPMEYQHEESSEYLKQRFVFGHAFDNATEDKVDLCSPNLLDELYERMTVYIESGEWGRFHKKANDSLLKYCEDQLKEEQTNGNRRRALYVYVSDLHAFDNIYCNDQYFMRTERYNQKEIGIIRYTNDDRAKIEFPVGDVGAQEKIMCFNIWQIIKHINLENRKQIIKSVLDQLVEIGCAESVIKDYDLHHMYVGIDYCDWSRQLVLHCAVDDEGWKNRGDKEILKRFLMLFVEQVVIPMFNDDRNDLFQQYFWKAISSLLYGNAKNIQEMLLLHLLRDKPAEVGKAVIAERNDEELVKKNINRYRKYSFKRFIDMIMTEYDISAVDSLDQRWTAYVINKNDVLGGKKQQFENVRQACENIGYKESFLYRNCENA